MVTNKSSKKSGQSGRYSGSKETGSNNSSQSNSNAPSLKPSIKSMVEEQSKPKTESLDEALKQLSQGKELTRNQAKTAMLDILKEEVEEAQISAFIMGLKTKGESIPEIAGLLDALDASSMKVKIPSPEKAIDTCGTGGDSQSTFNVSTLAALVAAAGGAKVVKHGNVSATSPVGSAELLNHLGVNIRLSPEGVANCVKEVGIGFCFARDFHPGFGKVAKARKALGLRTVFNILGPLANPAQVGRQIVGAADAETARQIIEILKERGANEAMVVCGSTPKGSLDEISTLGTTQVLTLKAGKISESQIDPSDFQLEETELQKLQIKSLPEALTAAWELLESNAEGPKLDIVALNAGAALELAGQAADLSEGFETAKELVKDGSALKTLHQLIKYSNEQTLNENVSSPPEFEFKDLKPVLKLMHQVTKNILKPPQSKSKSLVPLVLKNAGKYHPNRLPTIEMKKLQEHFEGDALFRSQILRFSINLRDDPIAEEAPWLWFFRPIGWEADCSDIYETKKAEEDEKRAAKERNRQEKDLKDTTTKLNKVQSSHKKERLKLEADLTRTKQKLKASEESDKNVQKSHNKLSEDYEKLQQDYRQKSNELERTKKELKGLRPRAVEKKEIAKKEAKELREKKEKSKEASQLKQRKKDFTPPPPKKFPKPVPPLYGLSTDADEFAEHLVSGDHAVDSVLILDGYNITLEGKGKGRLPDKQYAGGRERLRSDLINVLNKFPIEDAFIFWDAGDEGSPKQSRPKTSQYHLKESFVPDADESIVKFCQENGKITIVVTNDNELMLRVKKHDANTMDTRQFSYLAKKAKRT